MKRTLSLLTLLFLMLVVCSPAAADPCDNDLKKFCPLHSPKDPFRLFCLKNLESQISAGCKATLRDVSPDPGAAIDICGDDIAKVCGGIEPGESRVLKCLKKNSKQLSFECRKKVNVFPDPK